MITKHFLEIKNRFLVVLFLWVNLMFICYFHKETLLFIFFKPGLSYTRFCLIFTNLTEAFMIYVDLSIFISNQTIILYLIYHFFCFIAPGLYKNEYKLLKKLIVLIIFFWFMSLVIFYFLVLPASFLFFLSFQTSSLYFEARINEYIYLYIYLYNLCFFYCQVFVLIILFLKYVKNSLVKIKITRKNFYTIFILISTLITPPDLFSQIILYFLILLGYEALILWSVFSFFLASSKCSD